MSVNEKIVLPALSADEYEWVRSTLIDAAREAADQSVVDHDPFYLGIVEKLDPALTHSRVGSTSTTFTYAQVVALSRLHDRHGLDLDLRNFTHQFDLPQGYVAGWVGRGDTAPGIYVGVSPEGEVSS
jgi:hypothetical protein